MTGYTYEEFVSGEYARQETKKHTEREEVKRRTEREEKQKDLRVMSVRLELLVRATKASIFASVSLFVLGTYAAIVGLNPSIFFLILLLVGVSAAITGRLGDAALGSSWAIDQELAQVYGLGYRQYRFTPSKAIWPQLKHAKGKGK